MKTSTCVLGILTIFSTLAYADMDVDNSLVSSARMMPPPEPVKIVNIVCPPESPYACDSETQWTFRRTPPEFPVLPDSSGVDLAKRVHAPVHRVKVVRRPTYKQPVMIEAAAQGWIARLQLHWEHLKLTVRELVATL